MPRDDRTAAKAGKRARPAPARDAGRHTASQDVDHRWLLLVYRIPTEPTRLRAGVWRKLKSLGAIYVQSSTAAIPSSPRTKRAMRSLQAEISGIGGTAVLFDAAVAAGGDVVRSAFNNVRDDEYEEIVDRCEDFLLQVHKEYDADHFTYAELEENEVDLVKLKGWLDRVRQRDVLGASRLDEALTALARCEQTLEDYAARVYAEEGEEPG